jgi:hypothetical protein
VTPGPAKFSQNFEKCRKKFAFLTSLEWTFEVKTLWKCCKITSARNYVYFILFLLVLREIFMLFIWKILSHVNILSWQGGVLSWKTAFMLNPQKRKTQPKLYRLYWKNETWINNYILVPEPTARSATSFPGSLGKTLVSAGHVPRPKLIARGGVVKVSNSGIGWSRASSKIDRPRGCGESIKLQTVKNIHFANYYQ